MIVTGIMPAIAGADYYTRVATASNMGKCGSGHQLIETVNYGADIHGIWESISTACLIGNNIAEWVVVAKVQCQSEYDPSLSGECFDAERTIGAPLIFTEDQIWPAGQKGLGHKFGYRLVKYAAGKTCTVLELPDKNGVSRPIWRCDDTAIVDGTKDSAGNTLDVPSEYVVRQFQSVSHNDFMSITQESANFLPTEIDLPEDKYSLKLDKFLVKERNNKNE